MAVNYIWGGFIVIAFIVALIRLLFGNTEVFPAMMDSTFEMARTGFELSLYLTGLMALWLGLMRIGEKGGVVPIFSRIIGPFFTRLFPEVPRNHPATGSMVMNFSANLLGLDNAATPLGLKAMKELQEINPTKDTASNAQIMFLVLNTSGFSVIPLTIMMDRANLGAVNPTDIFLPTLIATYCSSVFGLIIVSIYQRINLFDRVILTYLGGFTALLAGVVYYFSTLSDEALQLQSRLISAVIILSFITFFVVLGIRNKVPLFETFVEGAKEGFDVAIRIIPYLVGFLVAIGLFRESGVLGYITGGIAWIVEKMGINSDFTDALPVALMRPLSGSGARGMMMETISTFGVDSFTGRLASVFRGCTETTFYILALYFGSVSLRKTRYALTCGLLTDLSGIIAAILVSYLFFH